MKKEQFIAQIKIAMRLTVVQLCLLAIFTFNSFANSPHAQEILNKRISVKADNMSLSGILNKIQKAAQVKFVYSPGFVNAGQKVSLEGKDEKLSEILDKLFKPLKVRYDVEVENVILLFAESNPGGQERNGVPFTELLMNNPPATVISGRVVDEKGEPVVGASVKLKNSSRGTVTDSKGGFEIGISDNSPMILVFSFVGMEQQEINAAGRTTINIILRKASNQQQEVVVVGYGTQKKGNLTGAVTNVKGAEIAKNPSVNISNSFAGLVSGVIANNRSGRPGDDASTLFIRGVNSFGGGTNPLVVIDGIPDRDMNRINPDDIESVTVLKDASAAIYGVRSANGVILVTTKRGKSGKAYIQYDGSVGTQQLTRLDKRTNAWEYMTYYNELNVNQGNTAPYLQSDIDKYKAGNDPNYTSTDWLNAVYRKNAPQTSHSISVSGGTDQVKAYLSAQYLDQRSNFRNSDEDFKQFNIRSNIDARISDNIKVYADLALRKENRTYPVSSPSSLLHEAVSMYPYLPVYWKNGFADACVSNGRNPVIMTSSLPGYDKTINLIMNPKLGFDIQLPYIVKGLSLSGYGAFDYNIQSEKIFQQPWDAYTFDKTTGIYNNQRASTSITSVGQNDMQANENTFFMKLAFDRQIGKHVISAFAGYEQTTRNITYTNAYRRDLLSNQLDQMFTGSTVGQNATGSAYQDGRESWLGRLSYVYGNKYLIEATARYNGSFNFPTANRWGLFPAVSAGWRISDENFFKDNISWISQFKFRGSWGLMGSDDVAQYLYVTRYQLVTNANNYTFFGPDYTLANALYLSATPNPDITWEKQDSKNIGFDANLLSNRLTVNFDLFRYARKDILAQRNASVPQYTGLSLPAENIGKSLNTGYEVAINYSEKRTEVKYHFGVNFTYAKSKIVFQDESPNIPVWQKATGQAIGAWMVYQTNGIYHTQKDIDKSAHMDGAKPGDLWIKDVDGDGKITNNDMVRVPESATPQMIYGLTMGVEYKGLALDLVWSGQGRAKQMILSQMQGSLVNPPTWLYDGRYTADNTNSLYPRAFNANDARNSVAADFWLRDASFLRLKSAEISYTLPARLLTRIGASNIRFFVSGFNLLTFDKMKKYNIDPETNNVTGVNYPQTRIFRCGLNIGL